MIIALILLYLFVGAIVSSVFCIIESLQNMLYRPTTLTWVVLVMLWPAIIYEWTMEYFYPDQNS